MRSIILILITVSINCILFTSCYVCDRVYLPLNEQDKTKTHFSTGLINIGCHVPPTDQNVLIITVWFDENTKGESIDDFNIDVVSKDRNAFKLKSVDATCLENNINPLKDKHYTKNVFKDLGADARMTSINNAKVYFTFEFLSENLIKFKNIDLKYIVSFSNRNPVDSVIVLKGVKTCSFRIH